MNILKKKKGKKSIFYRDLFYFIRLCRIFKYSFITILFINILVDLTLSENLKNRTNEKKKDLQERFRNLSITCVDHNVSY